MAIPSKPGPIYNIIINSPEDIERAINNSVEDKQKITRILSARRYGELEQVPNLLNIAPLCKEIYCNSLGFATCQKIVKGIESYRVSLKNSFVVCNNMLTPLFMRAFACHQMTIPYYAMENPKDPAAIMNMVEIGQIAKTIEGEYNKLGKEFNLLRDQESDKLSSLIGDQCPIYKIRRNFKEDSLSDSLRKPILEKALACSDGAIKSLGCLTTNALDIGTFCYWAESHSESLGNPILGLSNPDWIELMLSEGPDEFSNFLLKAEKVLDVILPEPQSEKSLTEVVASPSIPSLQSQKR